jgi:hypothetical protein
MPEQEITLKNTKQEILDALNKALKRAEAFEKGRLDPQRDEKERTEKRAVASARESVEKNIFSKELNEKYTDLQTAITAEETRLQELYGVGRELQKLALAIEAGKERIAEIERERTEKETAAQESTSRLRADYAQRNAELQAEYEKTVKQQKTERTREADEYQYNLARTRERETNQWEDDKAAREAELKKRETQTAELLAAAESKAAYVQSLEAQVADIQNLLAAEKEAAVGAVTEKLNTEHAHQSALAELERKGAVSRLEDKAAYLEKELDASAKTNKQLQDKLDKAYSEMRDLATKTVESAGGVKILGSQGAAEKG